MITIRKLSSVIGLAFITSKLCLPQIAAADERQCSYVNPETKAITVVPESRLTSTQLLAATCVEPRIRHRGMESEPKLEAPSLNPTVSKIAPSSGGLEPSEESPASETKQSGGKGFSVDDYREVVKEIVPREVRPEGLKITNGEREENLITPLGDVRVRWSRGVEKYFDKNPKRAIAEAWGVAARALAQRGFPTDVRRADFSWQLVVVDESQSQIGPRAQNPGTCHPAWMTPPADIYVKAKFVASGCGSELLPPEAATNELTSTLIHELGHAVEFRLMKSAFARNQRWHAEGFATWFETVAAPFVPSSRRLARRTELIRRAKAALTTSWHPGLFQGTPEDYARAFALISWVTERYSVGKLLRIYEQMEARQQSFEQAAGAVLGISMAKWVSETNEWLSRQGR